MTTESPESLQALLTKTASELVNAKARIRELESIITCKPEDIDTLPTPETDAHMAGGSYSFDGDFARNLERHRDFLSTRIIERTVAFERKDRERCDVIRELKMRILDLLKYPIEHSPSCASGYDPVPCDCGLDEAKETAKRSAS